MDFFETVERRHSYRGPFTRDPVSGEDLRRIVQAGLTAPSGKNRQTTAFVIVDDPALLREIAETSPPNQALATCSALICAVVDTFPEAAYHGHSFVLEDCSAAVENILLAVTALGYASVWLDGMLRIEQRAETIGTILGLPADKRVQVMLPVGKPAEHGPRKKKKPFTERTWFNRYGG